MNFEQIRTFLWVAKLGGFRKAAEKLNTSQPAVSARIAALEDRLGAALFERGQGGVRLTAKGRELLSYAEKLVYLSETMQARMEPGAQRQGLLRLGVSETIVHSWLPRFLGALSEAFPKIEVELTVDVSTGLRDELISRSIDLAFLMGPISEFSVTNLDLPSFALDWYIAAHLAPEQPGPEAAEALFARLPVITYARNTRPFTEIKAYLYTQVGEGVRLFPSTSLAACIRMVEDGVGIGSLPVSLAADLVAAGRIVSLAYPWRPSPLRFTASYVGDPPNPLAQAAAELAETIAGSDSL